MSPAGSPAIRIAAFAGLAAFAIVHWAALVDPAPAGRLALCVAIAVAGAAGLEAIGRSGLRQREATVAAVACALASAVLAFVAIGIAPRLLWPGGWGELAANLDSGLAGLAGDIEYPYREGNEWSRLALLAVAPLALAAAAAAAFWPAGPRGRLAGRFAGLTILLALFATAAAATSPEAPLLRGAALLALVGAWLWLPSLRRRQALVATALVAGAGVLAVPAAAQLRADDPWLNYRSWTLRSAEGTTYRWEHSYGPIDWPRDGTHMLTVHSEDAHYWKTVVLDRFDGVRWTRSQQSSLGLRDVTPDSPEVLPPGGDEKWLRDFSVTLGNLESEVVVGAGLPTRVLGVDGAATAPDGTTITLGDPLRPGDSYTVRAYVPDPTEDEMRAAAHSYPEEFVNYTQIELPSERLEGGEKLEPARITVPLRRVVLREPDNLDPAEEKRIRRSVYGEMFDLARELTAGEETAYDAVSAIRDHLREAYEYSEVPPQREYPLASFLEDDRRGYCQQFSGTMALMLRMVGIPARVVGGFAPGSREGEDGPFRVEDFDAHSWVEVYFSGIGWVTFDPTPNDAPVSSQQRPGFPTSAADGQPSAGAPEGDGGNQAELALPAPGAGGPGGGSGSATGLLVVPAVLLAMLAAASLLVALRARRHRRLDPGVAVDAQLDELAAALERFGWRASNGATLLGLERRLHRSRRRASARYIAGLRASRYANGSTRPPGLDARRKLRRELAATLGLRGGLIALLAIPPGGPWARRRSSG